MKRRALLGLLASSACHGMRGRELSLGRALVGVSTGPGGADAEQARWALSELLRLADEAEGELRRASRSPAAVISQLVFERWGFVREVADTNLGFVFLPQVLERRRGSCVGLGTLFLALADALGQAAAGVMLPGHFYVRMMQEQGQPRNVELLRSGEAMSDAWYGQRFPIPGGSAPEYARPLSPTEVLGVVEYNVGNERRRQLRLTDARAAFTRAVQRFPDLSEAHASLGAVEQLLGNLEAAAKSYQRARDVNPHLPGVDQNLALLATELSSRPH